MFILFVVTDITFFLNISDSFTVKKKSTYFWPPVFKNCISKCSTHSWTCRHESGIYWLKFHLFADKARPVSKEIGSASAAVSISEQSNSLIIISETQQSKAEKRNQLELKLYKKYFLSLGNNFPELFRVCCCCFNFWTK